MISSVAERGRVAALALGWLAAATALQWSVVRFRVMIVLTLTLVTGALAVSLWRRTSWWMPPRAGALVLLGSALVAWTVPLFTYLRGEWHTGALLVVTTVALAGAALLALRSHWHGLVAFWLAVVGHATLVVVTVLGSPRPKIDVWVVLNQAADALARGESFYSVTWTNSPGVQDFFPYLPWMAVLVAPGRWLFGDIRWALGVWSLLLLACLWWLAAPDRRGAARPWRRGAVQVTDGPALPAAAGVSAATRSRWLTAAVPALLLVSIPGGITQVDQAWTEPLLAALLLGWAVLVHRGRATWAIIPLALACASKQHVVLLLPLIALCRPFGWRRVAASGALAGVLISPWLLTDFANMWNDTVTTLVGFHAIRFANTWYLFFLNVLGIELPFWVTGLVILGAVAAGAWLVRRRHLDAVGVLPVMALVLAVANLVNKQAFYNQFWLSLALVAGAMAAARDSPIQPAANSPIQPAADSPEPAGRGVIPPRAHEP